MTRVLLVDDHQLLRQSLRRAIEEAGLQIVGEAADGEEAFRLAEQYRPDVVLMDVTMPVMDGITATKLIRDRCPECQVVVLTMHADPDVVRQAIAAGAAGYMLKDSTVQDVIETVRLVAAGESAINAELAASMLKEAHTISPAPGTAVAEDREPVLTKREEEVLQMFANGHSTTEVANALFISVKTVKNHLASIYQKLDARDRTQAIVLATRMGIIRLD